MADKKKKKVKQKQKQKQSQQVIINVGRASQPRSAKQQQPMSSPQPPPVVQYVYRDNLALNMLNEKARTQEAKTALDKTVSQAVTQAVDKAVAQTPPPPEKPKLPQPNNPPPTNLMRLLNNNKIHNSTFIPQETKKIVAHDFEKAISKRKYDDETEFEDNNLPVRRPNQGRQPPTPVAEATAGFTLPETAGVRLNKKGLPDRRSREGRLMYQQMMSQKNEEKSNDNALTATSASTTNSASVKPVNSASVQPVNFEPNDDEEEEFVVSRIKQKPA